MYCSKCGLKIIKNSKFCSGCGNKVFSLKEEKKEEKIEPVSNKENEKTEFIIIPTARLIIFSILSFGLYSIYWFTLNFNAIENRRKLRKKKTHPVLWGIFNTLSSEYLFRELNLIKKEATNKGFKVSPAVLGVLYFILMVFGGFIFISPFIFIFTALYFQKKAKEYSEYKLSGYKIHKLNWGEFAIVIFAIIVFIISYSNNKDMIANDNEQARQIISETIRDLNRELPEMVDGETRMDYALLIDNEVNYAYTFVNISYHDLDPTFLSYSMKNDLIQFICNSSDMKMFRDYNYNFRYSYYDKNNTFIEDVFIDIIRDCK